MVSEKIVLFAFAGLLLVSSCTPEAPVEKKEEAPVPVETKITNATTFQNNILGYSDESGPVGVFDVPEMLVLSIVDSSSSKDVAAKVAENYAVIEEEMNATGAEVNGPIGMISYNNDMKNFVFETVICIKKIPSVQPKKSKIVVLEASKMLVFNFYGSYGNLFAAYDKIKKYCDKNDLIPSGPTREFYITDPEKEKDPQKWLTRIMAPVVSMHKK